MLLQNIQLIFYFTKYVSIQFFVAAQIAKYNLVFLREFVVLLGLSLQGDLSTRYIETHENFLQ